MTKVRSDRILRFLHRSPIIDFSIVWWNPCKTGVILVEVSAGFVLSKKRRGRGANPKARPRVQLRLLEDWCTHSFGLNGTIPSNVIKIIQPDEISGLEHPLSVCLSVLQRQALGSRSRSQVQGQIKRASLHG